LKFARIPAQNTLLEANSQTPGSGIPRKVPNSSFSAHLEQYLFDSQVEARNIAALMGVSLRFCPFAAYASIKLETKEM